MSSGSNQKTLFQTWGASASQNKVVQPKKAVKKAAGRRKTTPNNTAQVATTRPQNPLWAQIGSTTVNPGRTEDPEPAFEDEDDDDLMVVAVYEAEKTLQLDSNSLQYDNPVGSESTALSLIPSAGQTYPDLPGFDSSSAKVWIYPTNYPIREYQMKMSEAALLQNTLVCLPTGLGKTFIASVVMYNFYRWYPSGKIVFMAPTKPLVAQQIEACYKVMGIPQAHMAELTGSTAAKHRQEVWRTKRVFFLTPQVMVNDLSRETCPAQQVKCVVIDEAHKALGNHAYSQVIRQLGSQTLQFRILALSATPGGDTKAVQAVISNLLISHIELRSEESPDIKAHSHQRSVEKMVVPLGEALSAYQARYLQVLEKFMSRLVQNRVMAHKDLRTLSKYQIILARDQFRKNPPPCIKSPQQGMLEGDFALCISLYHGYELLIQMGLRSLFFYIQGIMDGSREMSRARNELQRTPTFMDLYPELEAMFVKPSAGPDEPFIYSHPKLEKLEEVVLQHFRRWAESSADNIGPQEVGTRVMIFSSYRESVQEIAAMLNRHATLIKVMTFMGQASAGKGVKGFTQKEQLEVVSRFRQGGFNTLVSTCVGEEGLDIGEVDLIVCFDAQKNPIRLVQRMGRTGRKRQGRIVVILAEGREERTYNQSQSNKRSVDKSIIGNKNGFHMYPNSPRMLPEGVNPTMHKMHIICGQFDHRESSRRSVRGRRSHSEGRASLIHPQNLMRQGSATSDGFLSSTEYSLWASTMKLGDDEAHPTLKQSHFMSLPSDLPPQEDVSKSGPPSRELSLWEWRHWQHKAFPTHVVDHSLRCNHFIKVMELVDGMREENEGECRYEQELLPYLHKADAVGHVKKGQKKQKTGAKTTNNKAKLFRSTLPDLERFDEEGDWEQTRGKTVVSPFAVTKQRLPVAHDTEAPYDDMTDHPGPEAICPRPSNNDCPEADMDDDCVIIDEDVVRSEPIHFDQTSQLITKIDEEEEVELQAMFYLPKWDSAPPPSFSKLLPGRDQSLNVILANVAELLSRSPPPPPVDLEADMAAPSLPPSPQRPHQPFQVSFTLDVDDDDDDDDEVMMSDADDAPLRTDSEDIKGPRQEQQQQSVSIAANSPSWDEVFGEEDVNYNHDITDNRKETDEECVGEEAERYKETKTHGGVQDDRIQMDESMDLFGDDEAFLQMSIPDIPTPGVTPRTSPSAGDIANSTKNMSLHTHTPTNPHSTTRTAGSAYTLNTAHTDDLARTKDITPHSKLNNPTIVETKHTAAAPSEPVTDCSHDYYSVNFDLGYSLEDSDETEEEAVSAPCMLTSPQSKKHADSTASLPAGSSSSTPYNSFHRPRIPLQSSESKEYTPQMLPEQRKRERSSLLASPSVSTGGALPSPITSPGARRMLMPGCAGPRNPSLVPLFKQRQSSESKVSTPQMLPEQRKRETSSLLASPSVSTGGALPSPITSPGARRMLMPGCAGPRNPSLVPLFKQRRLEENSPPPPAPPPPPVECISDSEDEVVVHKRRHQNKVKPLSSPDVSKMSSDVDSPLVVRRKRAAALNTSDEMEGEAVSDEDFQNESVSRRITAHLPERQRVQQGKAKHPACRKGRQFLVEEAELSDEGADVSSDEEDGDDQNRSLDGFVVDNTHLSQGLNESEMQGIYLKSVRSPDVQGKFKLSYRNHHNMDIFSQVPEMDETYAEDSFVVGSEEVESSEGEEAEDIELMPEDSYVEGRRQYATRRRVFQHKARAGAGTKTTAGAPPEQRAGVKTKRARVIHIHDSSEEETEEVGKKRSVTTGGGVAAPLWPKVVQPEPSGLEQQQKPSSSSSSSSTIASKVSLLSKAQKSSVSEDQQKERCRQRMENQHLLSNELDFAESELMLSSMKQPQVQALPAASSAPQTSTAQDSSASAPSGPVCILVDSRCISGGVELMTSLRQRHAATVHVCSLDGSYFIVSNRTAVERHSQSDLAAAQNRKRLAERVNSLLGLFERVCVIVEKDRTKPGEASRPFQRTRYYDSTLTALVRTGVRLLWSDGAEESAGLLAGLARLEQRKGQGIAVPLEVKGHHRQQALQLYLGLPSVNYVHALSMSQNFRSIAQLINSSIEAIQKGGCMSRSRAEEIYRFLRYSCDSSFMNTSKSGKTS
ncbi:Fanconi anemia group M protein isoform X1 [Sebastes umbrosus]|uniref:Fanconi anemia group M protein isoform X1 n=1 Tax=Sebastes umbrosus TaxID=72105 RepID=UPI00189F975B|nr:Fanconi anemia group M protein isoform X1 [Sebastes umbrosus]